MNRDDFKDNPLLSIILTFQDGVQLGLQMDHPVPQGEAMKALGHFAADVGVELDITLPRPTKDLVAEAIEHFLAEAGGADTEWSSDDMAEAIVRAVVPDDLARAKLLIYWVDVREEFRARDYNGFIPSRRCVAARPWGIDMYLRCHNPAMRATEQELCWAHERQRVKGT